MPLIKKIGALLALAPCALSAQFPMHHPGDLVEHIHCTPHEFRIFADASDGRTIGIEYDGQPVMAYLENKSGEDVLGISFEQGSLNQVGTDLYFAPKRGAEIRCEFDK